MWVIKLLRTLACFCVKSKDHHQIWQKKLMPLRRQLSLLNVHFCLYMVRVWGYFLFYFVVIFSCVLLWLSTSCLGLFPSISVHICYLFLCSCACPPVLVCCLCFWFVLFSFFSDFPFVACSFDLGFWTFGFIIKSLLFFFYLPTLPVSTFGSSLLCSSLHDRRFKCIIVSSLAENVLVWVSDSMLRYCWHYGLHNVGVYHSTAWWILYQGFEACGCRNSSALTDSSEVCGSMWWTKLLQTS